MATYFKGSSFQERYQSYDDIRSEVLKAALVLAGIKKIRRSASRDLSFSGRGIKFTVKLMAGREYMVVHMKIPINDERLAKSKKARNLFSSIYDKPTTTEDGFWMWRVPFENTALNLMEYIVNGSSIDKRTIVALGAS